MTILGDALKIMAIFSINCAALRVSLVPGEPDIQLLNAEEAIQSPRGWRPDIKGKGLHPNPEKRAKAILFVHIPKTAGSSFIMDAVHYLPKDIHLYANERCITELVEEARVTPENTTFDITRSIPQVATFLRNPRSHVYSQFLQLRDSPWGKYAVPNRGAKLKNLQQWLSYFVDPETNKVLEKPTVDVVSLGGYHPLDMQTRAFTCERNLTKYHETDFNRAVDTMHKVKFVGFTEYYHESTCLFYHVNAHDDDKNVMKAGCDCENEEEWSNWPHHADDPHKVKKHSLEDLSEQDLALIDKMTQEDQKLYNLALKRFFTEIDAMEKATNTKVFCGERPHLQ